MDRNDIAELHYIAPVQNLPSILELGILSHNGAQRVDHRSVAMDVIQDRRSKVLVPGGRPLHDYVNLYINGRNPMMFTVARSRGPDGLCLLRISPEVIDQPGVVVTDCNASSDYVRFSHPAHGFTLIEREVTFARYWTHEDPFEQLQHKSRMCAEVLVPERVPPAAILGAYAGSTAAGAAVTAAAPSLDVSIDRYKFFQ